MKITLHGKPNLGLTRTSSYSFTWLPLPFYINFVKGGVLWLSLLSSWSVEGSWMYRVIREYTIPGACCMCRRRQLQRDANRHEDMASWERHHQQWIGHLPAKLTFYEYCEPSLNLDLPVLFLRMLPATSLEEIMHRTRKNLLYFSHCMALLLTEFWTLRLPPSFQCELLRPSEVGEEEKQQMLPSITSDSQFWGPSTDTVENKKWQNIIIMSEQANGSKYLEAKWEQGPESAEREKQKKKIGQVFAERISSECKKLGIFQNFQISQN